MSDREQIVYDTAVGRTDRCQRCGRPADRCGCDRRSVPGPSATNLLRISRERKGRKGKTVTIVQGLPANAGLAAELCTNLKRLCGSGGTVTESGTVEIQGDHRERVAARLREQGFTVKLAGG